MTDKRPGIDLVGRFADHLSRLGDNIGQGGGTGAAPPTTPSMDSAAQVSAAQAAAQVSAAKVFAAQASAAHPVGASPSTPPTVMQAQDGISNPMLELDLT